MRQKYTPLSPCDRVGDEVVVCAALALAYAGLEATAGLSAADSLVEKVQSDSKALFEAYASLGWDHGLCDVLKRTNDAMPGEQRSNRMAEFLNSAF